MQRFRVKYKIQMFGDVEYETEPYSEDEARSHADDIRGFEGVHSVYLVPVKDQDQAT